MSHFRHTCGGAPLALPALAVECAGPADRREWAEQIESAVREIERYLHAHPNASDTLEGVRNWWLAGPTGPFTVDVIQAALDRLVENRVLEARSIPGGVLYGGVKHRDDT